MKVVRQHDGIETFKTVKLARSLNRCQELDAHLETRVKVGRYRRFRPVVVGQMWTSISEIDRFNSTLLA
jgi:hypothetical protein